MVYRDRRGMVDVCDDRRWTAPLVVSAVMLVLFSVFFLWVDYVLPMACLFAGMSSAMCFYVSIFRRPLMIEFGPGGIVFVRYREVVEVPYDGVRAWYVDKVDKMGVGKQVLCVEMESGEVLRVERPDKLVLWERVLREMQSGAGDAVGGGPGGVGIERRA